MATKRSSFVHVFLSIEYLIDIGMKLMTISAVQMQHVLPSSVHLPYIQINDSVVNVTKT